ncbi:Cell envelope-related transcriptional attenuator [Syntrophomonas zehnderi OL-4]|uniref:Cell envelope-related transcriptional attenuator n=1 Tax=Syntrophomonas zehnderi OL-4 TaxID=690567 RepID=A0A0E4C863_9FIRM|nr:LCP family protein [Syntrophomonas zehnderi]CFX28640.1 Cell envelope-related transcriptional attenuator [Syntrophomonas zehnderi OL-4]
MMRKKGTISILILVFLGTFAIGALLGGQFKGLFKDTIAEKNEKGETINVLFMGIDARDGEKNSRSDTMILASIDSQNNKVAMVSIPRDTRIKNTFGRDEKINSVNYTKGPEAACKEVGKLLDVRVEHYVITNFDGFGEIVDTLGGVDIDVETNMVHRDVSYSINLSKGHQHLNGDQALQYVRYRGGPTADIGRTQRQQKFIKALAEQMFQTNTITKLPKLLPQIVKYVDTNISMQDMLHLAQIARKIDIQNITTQTLPGYPYTDPSSGASYWEADKTKAKILVSSLLQGKTFPVVGDPPSWISKNQNKYKPVDLPLPDTLKKNEPEPKPDVKEPDTIDVPVPSPGTPGDGNTNNPEPDPNNPGEEPVNPDPGTPLPPEGNPGGNINSSFKPHTINP